MHSWRVEGISKMTFILRSLSDNVTLRLQHGLPTDYMWPLQKSLRRKRKRFLKKQQKLDRIENVGWV